MYNKIFNFKIWGIVMLPFCFGCQFILQKESQPLVFSVMGCGPYNEAAKVALKKYVNLESKEESDFVAHLGDLFAGTYAKEMITYQDKGEKYYREMAGILSQNHRQPTYVLPGDNETIDRKDPEVGFQFWHTYFDNFHHKVKPSWVTQQQKGRKENFSFVTRDVVVIGIHKVGGKVMEGPYWEQTLGDAQAWIANNLREHSDTKSAIILSHAGLKGGVFKERLFESVKAYQKPVIYIHADGHKWFEKKYDEVTNFYHIQLDLIYSKNIEQGPFYPPVQFTITGDPKQPFRYDRRLHDKEWHDIKVE